MHIDFRYGKILEFQANELAAAAVGDGGSAVVVVEPFAAAEEAVELFAVTPLDFLAENEARAELDGGGHVGDASAAVALEAGDC